MKNVCKQMTRVQFNDNPLTHRGDICQSSSNGSQEAIKKTEYHPKHDETKHTLYDQ